MDSFQQQQQQQQQQLKTAEKSNQKDKQLSEK